MLFNYSPIKGAIQILKYQVCYKKTFLPNKQIILNPLEILPSTLVKFVTESSFYYSIQRLRATFQDCNLENAYGC